MTYEEAFRQMPGTAVMVIETGKRLKIKQIEGYLSNLFFALSDGCTYHHSEIMTINEE